MDEKDYFGSDRKLHREERKRKKDKDRSKYKKSDQKKYLKALDQEIASKTRKEDLKRGRVISIQSEGIIVACEGQNYRCTLRGLLKKEKTNQKNLSVVGDWVFFSPSPDFEGVIDQIEPRKTTLSRADNLSRNKEQLIAANIDQVLITLSVYSPPLKIALLDRYLIATKKGGMTPIILINKMDLINRDEEQKNLYLQVVNLLKERNILLIPLSTKTGEGLDRLIKAMQGKSSCFSGQSGVGKSSLINATLGLNLPTQETVKNTKKGAHTTTNATLIPLNCGGWCIDTPGIKSFGLWELSKEDLVSHFIEFTLFTKRCKYPDCSHTHEEPCGVKDAIENGALPRLRYESYLSLLEAVSQEHLRR